MFFVLEVAISPLYRNFPQKWPKFWTPISLWAVTISRATDVYRLSTREINQP